MTPSAAPYNITSSVGIMSHFASAVAYVRDTADSDNMDTSEMLLRARIKSGDYFMTLSTEVENIAQNLADTGNPEAYGLEQIATELLYLHSNYQICKKQ